MFTFCVYILTVFFCVVGMCYERDHVIQFETVLYSQLSPLTMGSFH